MDVDVPHFIQIFVDPKFCECATYTSFNYLLTPNFVTVLCVNIVYVLNHWWDLQLTYLNLIKIAIEFLTNSCPIIEWSSFTSQKQLKTILDYSGMRFTTKMVSNGYCYSVDMWLIFSTRKSFSTYTYQFFWFVVEKTFPNCQWGRFFTGDQTRDL